MHHAFRSIVTLLTAVLSTAALASAAPAQAGNTCKLDFRRADGMWGTAESSRTSLGWETLTLNPTQTRAFVTDWKYEKTRNDGQTYYGSHGRAFRNSGLRVVKLTLKVDPVRVGTFYLDPGASRDLKGDIVEISCP